MLYPCERKPPRWGQIIRVSSTPRPQRNSQPIAWRFHLPSHQSENFKNMISPETPESMCSLRWLMICLGDRVYASYQSPAAFSDRKSVPLPRFSHPPRAGSRSRRASFRISESPAKFLRKFFPAVLTSWEYNDLVGREGHFRGGDDGGGLKRKPHETRQSSGPCPAERTLSAGAASLPLSRELDRRFGEIAEKSICKPNFLQIYAYFISRLM